MAPWLPRSWERASGTSWNSCPPGKGMCLSEGTFFTESVKEISQKYGLTENHVSVILNRTRNKLKDHLQKEGYL